MLIESMLNASPHVIDSLSFELAEKVCWTVLVANRFRFRLSSLSGAGNQSE